MVVTSLGYPTGVSTNAACSTNISIIFNGSGCRIQNEEVMKMEEGLGRSSPQRREIR